MAALKKDQGKIYKADSAEFKRMLKSAIKELETEDEDAKADDSVQGIVKAALDCAAEKRKTRKEAGEEVGELTEDEIMEAVAEVVAQFTDEDGEKADDPEDEEKADEDPEEKPEDEPKSKNTSIQKKQRKADPAPVQRKYSSIYLQGGDPVKTEQKKIPPLVQLGRAIKCIDVHGNHDPDKASYYAKKLYADDEMARAFKALNTVNPTAGGFLIPEIYVNQIIELLYAKTVVMELGAQKMTMPNGNLTIPKMTAGVRASWGGEQRNIPLSQPKFANIKLVSKRLEAFVAQSREIVLATDFNSDQIFANDIVRRMQLGIDYAALYGNGTEFTPLGIINNKAIIKIDMAKATDPSLAVDGKVSADFPVYIRSTLLLKNVDDQGLGWAFNSSFEGYLMNLKTETGTYIYRDEMNAGKLLGSPYRVSNQIETKQDGTTSLIFGNWKDFIVAEQAGLETYTTIEGSWVDEDGVQHNAFQENLAGTRALMYVDMAVRHDESFIVALNCKVAPSFK